MSDSETHCTKKGRARLLQRDAQLLSASPELVLSAEAQADGRLARLLVKRLVTFATLLGRMAGHQAFLLARENQIKKCCSLCSASILQLLRAVDTKEWGACG